MSDWYPTRYGSARDYDDGASASVFVDPDPSDGMVGASYYAPESRARKIRYAPGTITATELRAWCDEMHAWLATRRLPSAPQPASPWCVSTWEWCGEGGPRIATRCEQTCWPQSWHRVPMRCERAPQIAHGTWWAL